MKSPAWPQLRSKRPPFEALTLLALLSSSTSSSQPSTEPGIADVGLPVLPAFGPLHSPDNVSGQILSI